MYKDSNCNICRRFGPRCGGCDDLIRPSDLVRRARPDRVFHLSCFVCGVCGKQLNTGDKLYIMPDDSFVCKDDYNAQAQRAGEGTLAHHTTLNRACQEKRKMNRVGKQSSCDRPASV